MTVNFSKKEYLDYTLVSVQPAVTDTGSAFQEMCQMYSANGLAIEKCETTKMQVHLSDWLELTKTAEPMKNKIVEKMENDIKGKEKTGFDPYETDSSICFDQRWILILGKK